MEKIIIRQATINDAAPIALLARITFREAFGYLFRDQQDLLDYFDHTFSVAKISSSLQKENNIFFLAFCDELPVGYAKLKKYSPSACIDSDKISQLQKIYVLNDFQSKKIGRLLLTAIFEAVNKTGSDLLWLSVFVGNPRALNFYTNHDFSAAGTHHYGIGKENFEFTVLKKNMQ